MKKPIIGILDYGAGNTMSVKRTVHTLGLRSTLVKQAADFLRIDLLLIPGVGAFPAAMKQLSEHNLIEPIQQFSAQGKGVIGVCLGMQLLADISYEHQPTPGLGLIPGEVKPLNSPQWHIGWNTLNIVNQSLLANSHNQSFYFNHSYEFTTTKDCLAGITEDDRPIVAMVQKNNIWGFQFHPEKSQAAGLTLMNDAIRGLLNA